MFGFRLSFGLTV